MLPPKVTTSDGVSADELEKLCEQYKYDYRNRAIEKKVAGKDWEYLVYNKLDQVILSQDMNLKSNNEWSFTKYDAFGRIAYTGIITDNRDRKTIQNEATAYTDKLWTERGAAVMIGGVPMYYNDGGYPKAIAGEVLTIQYYDNYNMPALLQGNPLPQDLNSFGVAVDLNVKGLPTVSQIKVLGTNDWIISATAYDKKGRTIATAARNEYLKVTDVNELLLDFTGKVEKSKTTHGKDGQIPIVTLDTFTYDHMGRLMKEIQTINGQEETIAENKYDALGQLENKTTGGGLQTVKYHYNVRGWLRGINDVNNLGNNLFAYQINYNNPTENLGASALYDGNISETLWKTANDNTKRAYGFRYDPINRLVAAKSNDGKYDVTGIQYDPMGNITNLTRNGWQNSATFTNMDVLSYQYDTGHRLLKVTDSGNKTYGFKDGSNTNNDYVYNTNGSLTADRNKGVTSISYNHLNLPIEVIFDNSATKKYEFVYDATGQKLKKTVTNGGAVTTTEYAGKAQYKNGTLQFISHTEGYVEPDGNKWIHVYQFKDHLQSLRLSYADNNRDGIVGVSEIREENNTYPFGLKHEGYNTTIRDRDHQYDYLGQERNEELGLNWLTFRYRNYMPEIGRFFGVDPVSEEYMSISTYQFAHNNPIWKIELEGLEGETINEKDKQNHEPIKVKTQTNQAFVGGGLVEIKVVQEATKEIAKKSSVLKNVLRVGGKVLGSAVMLLSDTMSPNTGGQTCDRCVHRGSEGHSKPNHGTQLIDTNPIDEKHRVDDKQVKTEGDNDSPVKRMGNMIDDLVETSTPGDDTKGRSTIYEREGGTDVANDVFDSFSPEGVKEIKGGRVGTLPDGSRINVRTNSKDGRTTIEIIHTNNRRTKFRFNETE